MTSSASRSAWRRATASSPPRSGTRMPLAARSSWLRSPPPLRTVTPSSMNEPPDGGARCLREPPGTPGLTERPDASALIRSWRVSRESSDGHRRRRGVGGERSPDLHGAYRLAHRQMGRNMVSFCSTTGPRDRETQRYRAQAQAVRRVDLQAPDDLTPVRDGSLGPRRAQTPWS